jgi:hypothetical protein
MEGVRAKWTDERLDDLNAKVDTIWDAAWTTASVSCAPT